MPSVTFVTFEYLKEYKKEEQYGETSTQEHQRDLFRNMGTL